MWFQRKNTELIVIKLGVLSLIVIYAQPRSIRPRMTYKGNKHNNNNTLYCTPKHSNNLHDPYKRFSVVYTKNNSLTDSKLVCIMQCM